jgi:hypothetical protein
MSRGRTGRKVRAASNIGRLEAQEEEREFTRKAEASFPYRRGGQNWSGKPKTLTLG